MGRMLDVGLECLEAVEPGHEHHVPRPGTVELVEADLISPDLGDLPGQRSEPAGHLEENTAAAGIQLTADDLTALG